ncbi:unnamed protein product [Protopolystoma xenopodis]|uniref:Uncharacterized protein n=1 Tax=Protopolystoma xenopodis TaxID=117903 RepID=A0A448WYQ1_9PLAT|nr:unnamed protein product [Protopolystoma xenopodis]
MSADHTDLRAISRAVYKYFNKIDSQPVRSRPLSANTGRKLCDEERLETKLEQERFGLQGWPQEGVFTTNPSAALSHVNASQTSEPAKENCCDCSAATVPQKRNQIEGEFTSLPISMDPSEALIRLRNLRTRNGMPSTMPVAPDGKPNSVERREKDSALTLFKAPNESYIKLYLK